ncbi:glycosyl transferase family group 2-domain-containing protein [Terfezia claveryi]|nr:glycosyl transferase family group 2-domain-containing protein [Terfezia claveryi]
MSKFFRKSTASEASSKSSGTAPDAITPVPPAPPSPAFRKSMAAGTSKRMTELSDSSSSEPELDVRLCLMSKYLLQKFQTNKWIPEAFNAEEDHMGLLLRQGRGLYVTQPKTVSQQLLAAVVKLNVEIAFTMASDITSSIIEGLDASQEDLYLPQDHSQYQIVESLDAIASAPTGRLRKFQYVCIVKKEKLVLLWHDSVEAMITHVQDVEAKLLALIWGNSIPNLLTPGSKSPHEFSVYSSRNVSTTKLPKSPSPGPPVPPIDSIHLAGPDSDASADTSPTRDVEKGDRESINRPLVFISAIYIGLSTALVIILLCGFSVRTLLVECLVDGYYVRFALLASIPIVMTLTLFFSIVMFSNVFQLFGPVTNLQTNSRYFSAKAPNLTLAYQQGFAPPHITIQMPVYKESLAGVIRPTVTSLKAAISQYELQGGTANIFINDDGLQVIDAAEAQERVDYYQDNNIGWVARPGHNDNGFIRAGKFKKASNMNFALDISNRTEDLLLQLMEAKMAEEKTTIISEHEEEELYAIALNRTIEESGIAWAGGNIRIGEIILIVDSDTRVPTDCLIKGAAEMFLSPEVAIIQHSAGVMQVTQDYFENGITFFTNLVYSAIRFGVGNGEVAPFVGHNAFLRWQAIQSVAMKGEDGKDKYWSESHVSEDFDVSLRLQCAGNVVRLGTYHDDGFKEGVSLTVYDELARWEKYAYGCNELVFHPIHKWIFTGPFTKLFLKFLTSKGPICSKIQTLGYIFSYYAMAAGLPFSMMNYLLVGWYNGYFDLFYDGGWRTFLSILVVFSLSGNVCLAVLRYRLGEKSLIGALIENFKWLPFFMIFLGGLSFHLNCAILAHMFSINMTWGATAKELEASNFFKEVPKIFKSFKWMYLCMLILIGGMIYLARFAPPGWTINEFTAIVPLAIGISAHCLLPFALNPALMIFNY